MATLEGGSGGDSLIGVDAENDSLWGDSGGDTLRGGPAVGTGAGNDFLDGGTGSDLLYGGDGDDTLIGGSGGGNDTLYGGAGVDTADFSRNLTNLTPAPAFAVNNTAVNVNLATGVATGLGTDSLFGIENVIGGGGGDAITGNDAANLLDGGGGSDLLYGAVGADTLIGGDGTDTLYGGIDNDILFGGASSDRLFGGTGADTLVGGAAADTLDGGLGSDTADYSASTGGVNVNLSDAALESGGDAAGDSLTGIENLIGSANDDILTGSNVANQLFGGGGADSITGNLGSDYIEGGAGNDTINAGPDSITGGAASPVNEFLDWTIPGSFNGQDLPASFVRDTGTMSVTVNYVPGVGTAFDVFTGTIFSPETLIGNNSGAFLSRSGAGELTELSVNFAAEAGSGMTNEVSNVLFRITDIDRAGWTDSVNILAYDELGNLVPVSITTTSGEISITGNTATATGNNTDPNFFDGAILVSIPGPVAQIVIQYTDLANDGQFIVVSDIHFTTIPATPDTSDADTVLAGLGDDLVETGLGADLVYGDEGRDTLRGEAGDDTLFGGIENDLLYGGLGNDSLEAGDGTDIVFGDEGNDTINFGLGNDTVFGGDGNDLIDDAIGSNLAGLNQIFGGSGNDTIWSGNDADTIYGDAGDDILNGEDGTDFLYGGADNDLLTGGAGNDILTGGTGTDTIFGGDDRDEIRVTFNPTANDALGNEFVDGGSGAGTSSDNDTLRVDILGFGWGRIDLVYDPTNLENGTITFFAANGTTVVGTLTFTDIENLIIVCFTSGTRIMTERGAVAVEDLAPGDLVLTRDNGMQPLRWVGRRVLSAADLMARPELQPVRIAAGALGVAGPERSMMLSPQHRVLVEGARSEMYFGEPEVLVPAKHLLGMADVSRALPADGVTYVHILFDRHEIVQSDGLWTESFQPAERTLNALDEAAREEVLALFPELTSDADAYPAARPSLKAHEARVLISG
jgi:Ca2+-binding RTX toxin-like protein